MTTNIYQECTLCPRSCRVDRHITTGYCGCTDEIRAARAALHFWEEPCISGTRGSGTIFFSGCTLRCRFCQNHKISQENFGDTVSAKRLSEIFLELQEQGAHNINLVTPTQYVPGILEASGLVREKLHIPIVYNCGGYEVVDTVIALKDTVNIWLPDLKYFDPELSANFSSAPDYFERAASAIRQMLAQTGAPVFSEDGMMKSGVIIRHLVLPGHYKDSLRILKYLHDEFPADSFLISLMSQYTPYHKDDSYPELNRRLTTYEYEKVVDRALELGLSSGFMQQKSSAKEEYTPPFELQGIHS